MDVGEYIRKKQRAQQENKQDFNQSQKISATEAIEKYSTMSEEQLMQELFRVGSVSGGNISANELDDFFSKVKSFLTPEQSAKMKDLIMQLKMQ